MTLDSPIASSAPDLLQVHQWGPTTIVSFVSETWSMDDELKPFGSLLDEIIETSQCRRLIFDLTDFDSSCSSLLALLVRPRQQGVEVIVCNPSEHLRDVMQMTRIDTLARIVMPVTRQAC